MRNPTSQLHSFIPDSTRQLYLAECLINVTRQGHGFMPEFMPTHIADTPLTNLIDRALHLLCRPACILRCLGIPPHSLTPDPTQLPAYHSQMPQGFHLPATYVALYMILLTSPHSSMPHSRLNYHPHNIIKHQLI